MDYAEVCVNSPAARRQTFTYSIPSDLIVTKGQAVLVPFGAQILQGMVIRLTAEPAFEQTRDIAGIIYSAPLISPERIELAQWISDYYLAPLFASIGLFLPPGFERKILSFVSKVVPKDFDMSSLSSDQRQVLDVITEQPKAIGVAALGRSFGKKKTQQIISQLIKKHLINRTYELEPIKVRPKIATYLRLLIPVSQVEKEVSKSTERQIAKQVALIVYLSRQSQPVFLLEAKKACGCDNFVIQALIKKGLSRTFEITSSGGKKSPKPYISLSVSADEAIHTASWLNEKITVKQAALLSFLAEHKDPVSLSAAYSETNIDRALVDALVNKGLIALSDFEIRRDPLVNMKTNLSWALPLTATQSAALMQITSSFGNITAGAGKVFLLHGITGSGKTEVYLQALAEAVKLGKKGIVLVPEIALTPQTLERFTARFPGRVAILHSQLTLGEQFDEWNRIRNGEVDVVVGPRSAIFAPLAGLGLIVIDEEHEWSYKQTDRVPAYHARDVALRLAGLTGATIILGSATPDVETYFHTRNGEYTLLELPERLISAVSFDDQIGPEVLPSIDGSLPGVDVVDMREELKSENRSLFSRSLLQAVTDALSTGGQVILFLNRRGASTFVQCRRCGFSFRCRRCDVPMTYHAAEETVICHQCNYRAPRPEFCPRCRSPQIKFLGLGTEKLEQETGAAFPGARLLRWDSDTTRGWHAHQEILDKFRSHQADILIGTQMVSKGLDMPRVTLVGIINADTGLNLPDFRAGERTFQLLSQVAGRAGRGPMGGRVVIQTYSPGHYAVKAAAAHDYKLFYQQEIEYRRQLHQPPFTRLATMILSHRNNELCRKEAETMKRNLSEENKARGIADIEIIGPAPAFIHRRRGLFRWQLVIRGTNPSAFLSAVDVGTAWNINIDPVGLN